VSLNGLIAKGAVPILGAKNRAQAKENAGGMGWNLNSEAVDRLGSISKAST